MVAISEFVKVHINIENPTVDFPSFDSTLIFDPLLKFKSGLRSKEYPGTSELLADEDLVDLSDNRLTTESEAYKAAHSFSLGFSKKFILGVGAGGTRAASQQIRVVIGALAQSYTLSAKRESDSEVTNISLTYEEAPTDLDLVYLDFFKAITKHDRLKGSIPILLRATGQSITGLQIDCLEFSLDLDAEGLTVDPNITITESRAKVEGKTIAQDLEEIRQTANFYYVVLASKDKLNIIETAKAVESQDLNIFITSSTENNIVDTPKSSGSDLANILFNAAYSRTALIYSADAAKYPEAQWISLKSSAPPGSVSWAYSDLKDMNPDNLSQGQFANAKAKNTNVFIRGGDSRRMTFDGKVVGNEFIDIISGVDWIRASIQSNVFRALSSRNEKIPFNNDGIAIIGLAVTTALDNAKKHVLDSYELNLPTASSFNAQERKERNLTKITWTGKLQGAIHTSEIKGSVSY